MYQITASLGEMYFVLNLSKIGITTLFPVPVEWVSEWVSLLITMQTYYPKQSLTL